ncbi:MAG TPA: hypothetical protein PLZ77_07310, partial [Lachnospiraceae bacterium]|nr:hypothetical protein [Lachnospiraceae bacterium]
MEYLDQGSPVEDSPVHYAYQFGADQYSYDAEHGLTIDPTLITINSLRLNTKYYAYLFCDYDLNNRAGSVRCGEIGSMTFTSASLSSLGDIFVRADINNVSANSADIIYTLNTDRTNDILEELLSSVRFDIVRSGGAEAVTDSFIEFDDVAMTNFKAANPIIMSSQDYFPGALEGQNKLQSMQEYKIVPYIYAMYQGVEYPMKVTLSNTEFKTMRAPAEVQLENILLAAGTLRFHAYVDDKDDAITGNSGHTVLINVYKYDGTFVQALRIPKNEGQDIEINDLEQGTDYIISFLAMEYNEGYDNTTFKSNYILEELTISESVNLAGSIKIQSLSNQSNAEMSAAILTTFTDPDKVMSEMEYYIDVTCDGVDVTVSGNYPGSYEAFNRGEYSGGNVERESAFVVKKGQHTYGFTLYVNVNGQKLILDTLSFTTEEEIIGIHNEWEFINKIKENGGTGKYAVCADLHFDSSQTYKENESGTGLSPRNIVEIFDGEIDFQGFEMSYNYRSDGSNMFHYLGEHADIHDLVLKAGMEDATSRMYDEGILCRSNYGHIHDVYVIYEGGDYLNNAYCGILCGSNSVSGIIENFVVKNCLTEDKMPFCVYVTGGLVCGTNYGMVRNGYVYGENIYSDVQTNSNGAAINVGGIVGSQGASGTTMNVYSLVNVTVPSPGRNTSQKAVSSYGSVIGNATGRLSNVYGIGQSMYSQAYNGTAFDETRGPVAGTNGSRNANVYYWNEDNFTYT